MEGDRHHASAALAPAERLHAYFWLSTSLWGEQFVHRMEGNWEAARETSVRLLPMAETPRYLADRVMLEYQQGDFAQGQAYLDRLLEVHGRSRPNPNSGYVMPALIIPLINRIDPKADHLGYAQSLAEELISSDSAPALIVSVARAGLSLLAVSRQDARAAQEHYSALLTHAGTMLHTGVIAGDRLLALLSETAGKPEQAERHFEDALRLCQRAGFLPEFCWCAYDLANLLLRTDLADKRDKATTLLDESLAITRRLGMLPLAELILNLQTSIATSPVNHHRLTRRELEVLHLLANGRSNREIARELVLSVRTVERHVTNLYAKIDARGRADATAYALRQGISGSP